LAITSDSARVAVVLRGSDGKSQIYTRTLHELKLKAIAGTENASGPFFSPDGQWIGFFDPATSKLKKIAVEGGPALAICDAASVRGASWGEDGDIVAALNTSVSLIRVPAGGGAPHELTPLKAPEVTQRYSLIHPRCGTAFLLWVMVISVFVYALLGRPVWYWLILSRILLLPVIAGIAYELIRFAGKHSDSRVLMTLLAPGLWLQRLTTREPTLDQLEVSIRALREVLDLEGREQPADRRVEVMA